jgi:putative resolvase
MKLSNWAKQQGISYLTAFRWWQADKLPIKAQQMPSGTILVFPETPDNVKENIVIYCRVSNQSRKTELEYQVKRCEDFCIANGWAITKTYKEVASGMNDNRKQFWKMLETKPTKIVIENKDRLTRFGFNYLDRLLKNISCEIVVINTSDTDEQDLLKDLVAVITSFCCRLYGLRRAQNKTNKIKKILKQND